jgi:hypothetical protein
MTIFSGILLGLASVGMIVGYSIWKQRPAQKELAGLGERERMQQRKEYANME